MGLKKETVVVANLRMGVGADFSTYYIVENYIVEAEKKRLGLKTYQIVFAAIGGAS